MRFDEILEMLYNDYKAFNTTLETLREEGLSTEEIMDAVKDFPHPKYPADPTEAVWWELGKLAITAFVSSETDYLLDDYLEV